LFGSIGKKLDLDQVVVCLTENPCKRFNLPVSLIDEDEMADLTLFDPALEYIFENEHILSKSKNSAFLGKGLKGKAYGIYAKKKLVLS